MKLVKGDVVDVIAPASSCSQSDFVKALECLEAWGLVPRYNGDILKPQKYLAQTDDFRFEDLERSLHAKDSKAVWCLRGGYGCIRLISYLSKMNQPSKPKLFIGLSDISIIHNFLIQKWNWKPVHGPVLSRLAKDIPAKEIKFLKTILFQKEKKLNYGRLKALNEKAYQKKDLSAKIVGGNLATLASSLGSSEAFDASGKIALLEDVGERGYSVDRMLYQLYNAGVFNKAKAVVFGDFTGGDEIDGKNLIKYSLKKFSETLNIPCYSGLKTGHGKLQLAIVMNAPAKIIFDKYPQLEVSTQW